MSYTRKTVDCWRFFVNYGQGWEEETIELDYQSMKENRRLYRENCSYPLRVRRGRIPA